MCSARAKALFQILEKKRKEDKIMKSSNQHDVEVVMISDLKDTQPFFVKKNGILQVKRGDTVTFRVKDMVATFWIPSADKLYGMSKSEKDLIFSVEPGKPQTFTFAKKKKSKKVTRTYQYAVYCEGKGVKGFAEAASSPRIIVEDDD
jgi:hypothetical protein